MVIGNNGDISTFNIKCNNKYPQEPPYVTLISTDNNKISRLFDNNSVILNSFRLINKWSPNLSIGDILMEIKNYS